MNEDITQIKFLYPRDVYDEFIIGLCMRTLRVIYDAEKIIHFDIVPTLQNMSEYQNSNQNSILQDAVDDFHHNFLFEPEENSKFIYSFSSSLKIYGVKHCG